MRMTEELLILSEGMRRFRRERSLTQEKCAKAAGISTQTWNSVENGSQKPSVITEGKIRKLIGGAGPAGENIGNI